MMKRCRWLKPVLVAQVKFTEWTHDNQLRQPVFLGLRTALWPRTRVYPRAHNSVVDGDTINLLIRARQQIRVRIAFIDAP